MGFTIIIIHKIVKENLLLTILVLLFGNDEARRYLAFQPVPDFVHRLAQHSLISNGKQGILCQIISGLLTQVFMIL